MIVNEIVLDCSIAVSWCFEDESSEKTDLLFGIVRDNGAWIPNLWHLEVVNVLIQAVKRNRIEYSDIPKRLKLLSKLPIKTDNETHLRAFSDIVHLAEETGLTSYDAAYLELASRRGLFLATSDKSLHKAAKVLGIPIVD